jgi:hypothetical protein
MVIVGRKVESSCELGNEPSGSIKCWELPNGCTSCGLSSGTQLHRVSLLVIGRKVSGSILDEAIDFFPIYLILSAAIRPWGLLSLKQK